MQAYKSSEKNKSVLSLESHYFTHLVYNYISDIKGIGQDLSISEDKLDIKVLLEKSASRIIADISFTATAKEGDDKIFNLSAGYKGIFSYSSDAPPKNVISFTKINAPAIIFPFLRSAIASLTLTVGVPPLILPIINFTNFPVKVEEK